MPDKLLTVEQILAILRETPTQIEQITSELTPLQLKTPPEIGEWSATEVLAHLRACADVWGDYITMILTEDGPSFRAVSPRTYIKQTDYPQQAFETLRQAFARQRNDLLTVLELLSPQDWTRSATVTGVGKPIARTVQNYGDRMARHERGHLRQFKKIVNTFLSQ